MARPMQWHALCQLELWAVNLGLGPPRRLVPSAARGMLRVGSCCRFGSSFQDLDGTARLCQWVPAGGSLAVFASEARPHLQHWDRTGRSGCGRFGSSEVAGVGPHAAHATASVWPVDRKGPCSLPVGGVPVASPAARQGPYTHTHTHARSTHAHTHKHTRTHTLQLLLHRTGLPMGLMIICSFRQSRSISLSGRPVHDVPSGRPVHDVPYRGRAAHFSSLAIPASFASLVAVSSSVDFSINPAGKNPSA
jgi:hypothetical protein